MKKITLLALTALFAAGALAAVKLLSGEEAESAPERGGEPEQPPADPDKIVAFPLKNKFADYSRGQDDPVYLFELETPSGTKELAVTLAHYETYYIGDEVICTETEKGLQVV